MSSCARSIGAENMTDRYFAGSSCGLGQTTFSLPRIMLRSTAFTRPVKPSKPIARVRLTLSSTAAMSGTRSR